MQASSTAAATAPARPASGLLAFLSRHPVVAAYAAALVPAIAMALTQPIWSLVDEAHHFDFIVQLGHDVYPVADQTLITGETVYVSEKTGVYRAFYPPRTYPTPDLTDVGLPPAGMSDAANAVWMQRHMWQLSREAIQTPGYYVLMVPVWWAADALGGPFAAIYALRIVNALLLATLAPMAMVVARILMPGRPPAAALAALFAILLPGLDLNLVRVSNDTLGAVLGGLLVVLAVRGAGTTWRWRRAAMMGLLLGAGMLVKLTLAGLLPVVAISILWPAAASTTRGRLARAALAGAIALLCLVPWLLINLHLYGGLTSGARGARVSDAVPHGLTADFIPQDLVVFVLTYWSGEPWGALPFSGALAVLGGLIALMAPVGIVKSLQAKQDLVPRGPLTAAVAVVLLMTAVTLALPATLGFEFLGPGRYAYPALPAAAALFAIGLVTVLPRLARQTVTALYATLAAAMLVAGALVIPAPPHASAGVPPAEARLLTTTGSGQFGGLRISIDAVALDATNRATWFHVTATNSGSDEVEWTVPPVVTTANREVTGEYIRSSALPGDIDPAESVTGWLYVPLDPSQLPAGGPITLRFTEITTSGYQQVGNVDLRLTWP
ncbi:MAG TPA: hypothetical protein VLK30_14095 [Candidatus Limnocylindrales bacterium]|nr:hypothetical protein [Candidatus Limnocylindrales bacterium]